MKFYLLIVFHIVGYISGLKTLKIVPSLFNQGSIDSQELELLQLSAIL